MSVDWPALEVGEELVEQQDETLWRQVNPEFYKDGKMTSQAFRPGQHDEKRMSTARASVLTAEEAYKHHTEVLGLKSTGSWGVTVAECEQVGLRCIDDTESPDLPANAPPGHTYVDFRPYGSNKAKVIGARLLLLATVRPPEFVPVP